MKISTKKKCHRLIREYQVLKKQGIQLTVLQGKYGGELTLIDNNAVFPSDFRVAVLETGI